eukprot:1150846-Pelagomonas_calceolata.AAC.1
MNVTVMRKDLSRTKVGRSSWDRAHKGSVRVDLVPGRGPSIIREKTSRDSLGDVFRDFYALIKVSLISTGIHTNKGQAKSAFADGFDTEAKANMMPTRPIIVLVCIPFIVGLRHLRAL